MDQNDIPNASPIQTEHYWGDCRIQGRMQEGEKLNVNYWHLLILQQIS